MKDNLLINTMAIVLFALLAVHPGTHAQQVEYSIPLDDNIRTTDFDIIGLCDNNLLVYKQSFSSYKMALYDDHLKIIDQVPLKFIPNDVKQADFVNLKNKVVMVYQYLHKRDIYCKAVILDGKARPLMRPFLVDKTSHPDRIVGEKAYSAIHSEDKRKIMVFEILRNEDSLLFHLRTFLFDSSMQLLQKGVITLPYQNEADRLDKFSVSDEGGLYFILGNKAYEPDSYYKNLSLYYKPALQNRLVVRSIPCESHFPQASVLLKIDEPHHKLWLNALEYDDKLRDIDRLATFHFTLDSLLPLQRNTVLLTDSLKNRMRGNEGVRQAFDDYQLSQMVIDQQENALVIAEEKYTDADHITHYDNLALFELDARGDLLNIQKIKKSQGSDLTATFASYLMINTGHALHLLMNKSHRVFRFLNNYVYLLADYRYDAGHRLKEMPVMRGLDNKKRWVPRYGKQVSRNEVVIPCVMGSSLIFGKITY